MDAYIDKENLVSIFKNSKTSETVADGMKLLKKHCNLTFNFTKAEVRANNFLIAIITQFSQGVGNHTTHTFLEYFIPERPLKSNFHLSIINKKSIFFINGDINKGKSAGSLFVADIGEEEDLFQKLMLFNNEYRCEKSLTIGSSELNSWSCLEPYAFPLTDLLIFDRWLFENKELLVSNFESWLKVFHKDSQIKTNIVIITHPQKRAPDLDVIAQTKKVIKDFLGKAPNVTLIDIRGHSDGKPKSQDKKSEHDRTIISNYLRFKSGDSFNYFNSEGKVITDGSELDIKSLVHSENNTKALEVISNLQKTIIWLEDNNPEAIQGDKKSNFLTFKI